jgi:hypothetical protein
MNPGDTLPPESAEDTQPIQYPITWIDLGSELLDDDSPAQIASCGSDLTHAPISHTAGVPAQIASCGSDLPNAPASRTAGA